MEIQPGAEIFITHDIVINDSIAFNKGEQAVVEQISENQQRPDYKYVVHSRSLDKRFQLSDNDILLIPGQQIVSPPVAQQVASQDEEEDSIPPSETSAFGWKKMLISGVSVLIVIGLTVALVIGIRAGRKTSETVTTTSPQTTEQTNSSAVQESNLQVVGIYKSTGILHDTLEFKADGTWVNNLNHSVNLDWNPDDPSSPPYIDRVFSGTYKVEAKAGEYPVDDVMHKTIADILIPNDKDPSKPFRWYHLTEDGNIIHLINLYVKQ